MVGQHRTPLTVLCLMFALAAAALTYFAVHKIRPESFKIRARMTKWISVEVEIQGPPTKGQPVTGDHDDADLAARWADQLRRTGGVQVRYTSDDDLTRYRSTGHDAGKLLDRPVQTMARDGVLHVALTDWGENPLETRLDDARTRNAIDKPFRAYPER